MVYVEKKGYKQVYTNKRIGDQMNNRVLVFQYKKIVDLQREKDVLLQKKTDLMKEFVSRDRVLQQEIRGINEQIYYIRTKELGG